MEFFNSLQTVVKLSNIIQGFAIGLVFLGGALQVAKWSLDKRIANLKTQIEEKREQTFKSEIGNLQGTISEQKEKLAKIDITVKARQFSEPNAIKLINDLSKYKGEQIVITNVLGDTEAFAFASQLKSIFEKAGFQVNGVNQAIYNNPIQGMIIVIPNITQEEKAKYVFALFQSFGFICRGEVNSNQKENIGLVVGSR